MTDYADLSARLRTLYFMFLSERKLANEAATALDDLSRKLRRYEERSAGWPDNLKAAVDELEERFDVALCSSQHLASWADRCNELSRKLAEAERERDVLRLQAQGEKAYREDAEAECAKLRKGLAIALAALETMRGIFPDEAS